MTNYGIFAFLQTKTDIPQPYKTFFDAGRVHFWDKFIDLIEFPKREAAESENIYFNRLSQTDYHRELIGMLEAVYKESLEPLGIEDIAEVYPGLYKLYSKTDMERMQRMLREDKQRADGEGFMKHALKKDIVQFGYYHGYIYQAVLTAIHIFKYIDDNEKKLSAEAIKYLENIVKRMESIAYAQPLKALANRTPS